MAPKVKPNAPDSSSKGKAVVSVTKKKTEGSTKPTESFELFVIQICFMGVGLCWSAFQSSLSIIHSKLHPLATKWMNGFFPDDGQYRC